MLKDTFQVLWDSVETWSIRICAELVSNALIENHSQEPSTKMPEEMWVVQVVRLEQMIHRWSELRTTLTNFGQGNELWAGVAHEPLKWFSMFRGEQLDFSPDDWPVIWSAHVRNYLPTAPVVNLSHPVVLQGYHSRSWHSANSLASQPVLVPDTTIGRLMMNVFDQTIEDMAIDHPYVQIEGAVWPQLGNDPKSLAFGQFHSHIRNWLYFAHQAWFHSLNLAITNQVVMQMQALKNSEFK